MAKAPFQYNPALSAISLAYKNPAVSLIADQVLPPVPVATENFGYLTFPKEDAFTVPDTRVGRTSKVNQIEFGDSLVTATTEDYGLEDPIPNKDIINAQNSRMGYDPLVKSTEYLTNLILLDREVRVAAAVFNAANYGASNKTTLSGTGQWSDPASDPSAVILAAQDAMIMKGNVLVLGRATWTAMRQNVNLVKKILGTAATSGLLTRQQVADALELQDVLVGESWVNTARKGQTAALGRTWGKHAALLYLDPSADTTRGITFGYTAEFENRIAGTILDDPDIGLRGGVKVRVGMSVKELVLGSDLGYFWQNATA
jgi:hypothetical protein